MPVRFTQEKNMNNPKIVPIEEGCHGKSNILFETLNRVIMEKRFDDMTVAEILGTLDLLRLSHGLKMFGKE